MNEKEYDHAVETVVKVVNALVEVRKLNGLNQREIGESLLTTSHYINNMESLKNMRGQPSLLNYLMYCNALSICPVEVLKKAWKA